MLQTVKNSVNTSLAERLKNMDLSPIAFQLRLKYGWNEVKICNTLKAYRLFMYLTLTEDFPIVPTEDVDTVWHHHILDTELYRLHCEKVFGQFVDHFPYFGSRSEEDANLLQECSKRSQIVSNEYSSLFDLSSVDISGAKCVAQCAEHGCNSCSRRINNTILNDELSLISLRPQLVV